MAANHFNSHLGLALAYLIFLISIPKSLSVLEPQPAPPSVWDILPKFGLPSGLLPSTVTDYVLHDDGRFIVMLDSPCYIQFEYLVYYEKTITGKLGYGSITDLEGIQVQRFFLWFDVNEIKVDLPPSDSIYFQVGFINKKLDVDQFKTIHSCRDEVTGSFRHVSAKLPHSLLDSFPFLWELVEGGFLKVILIYSWLLYHRVSAILRDIAETYV
ncbi:hypothetical protein Gorai_014430 [Gossypium raimondii]|uniref:Uncharacterized protein n=1 Tax=Gossypium raimondii TaxID=29730 RepID=A0A7J8P2V1_GOSRA|nr:hypothetical protein [Gossypium raimondii]